MGTDLVVITSKRRAMNRGMFQRLMHGLLGEDNCSWLSPRPGFTGDAFYQCRGLVKRNSGMDRNPGPPQLLPLAAADPGLGSRLIA